MQTSQTQTACVRAHWFLLQEGKKGRVAVCTEQNCILLLYEQLGWGISCVHGAELHPLALRTAWSVLETEMVETPITISTHN
jgi:hypothetical protein